MFPGSYETQFPPLLVQTPSDGDDNDEGKGGENTMIPQHIGAKQVLTLQADCPWFELNSAMC